MTHMHPTPQPIQNTYNTLKTQQPNIELRQLKNHYYIYQQKSHYNKQRKKTIKTTHYIGKIHPNGTYTPKKPKKPTQTTNTTKIYEYANSQLCHTLTTDLKNELTKLNFPYQQEIIALTITRTLTPTPIRLIASRWEKTYHSTQTPIDLTPKHITNVLTHIGNMPNETYQLYHNLSPKGGMLFYDLTSILSYSKTLKLAEKGYNKDHINKRQIKIALAFSTETWLPTAIDVFYGSMKETKIIKHFVNQFPNRNIGFIMDRGFIDYELLLDFKKQGIHYILALKKNSTLIPCNFALEGVFTYRKRHVTFSKVKLEKYGFLYLFLDPRLRGVQEDKLLGRVLEKKLSMDEFLVRCRLAGVVGLVSDLDVEARVVFEQYKSREEIEQVFDFMKNDLGADRCYLRGEDCVRGYFFVVLLAMRVYFRILQRLKLKGLVGVVSVWEVLFELSKVEVIVDSSGGRSLCAVPRRAERILSLFADYIPL